MNSASKKRQKPDSGIELSKIAREHQVELSASSSTIEQLHELVQTLSNRLTEARELQRANDRRVEQLLDVLLQLTTLDFRQRAPISDLADGIDAIAAGINALVDELDFNLSTVKRQSRDLEFTNKELESFTYSVSHDLRAPLRAVNGYANMLLEEYGPQLDEEGKRLIQTIRLNARKMGQLVDDLLEFSRLGRKELRIERVNLESMVHSIVQELRHGYTHPVAVEIGQVGAVRGDGTLLQHAIQNLLSNAFKYTSRAAAAKIEFNVKEEDGTKVYFVRDNGAGFDMTYYNKLFGVFQRLHRQEEFEGTGVGLAIVQRIIHHHRGRVWGEGKPGAGATFYFTLNTENPDMS